MRAPMTDPRIIYPTDDGGVSINQNKYIKGENVNE